MTAAVIGLNFCDLACTLWALRRGCVELNLLLRSVVTMMWYKGAVVPLLAVWLDRRGTREARYALCAAAAIYGAVCVWHAVGLWVITK